MMKLLNQQAFDAVFKVARTTGAPVYPELPAKEVPYPFISMGEVQYAPRSSSSALLGRVFVTLNVWGDRKQRLKVSELSEQVLYGCNFIGLETRNLVLDVGASEVRILSDNSTNNTLWHGVVTLNLIVTI